MLIEIVADGPALAVRAADIIQDVVRAKPDAVLGLPTGATPVGAYFELKRRQDACRLDCSRAVAFAIDEFAGTTRETPGTNNAFFRQYLGVTLRALHVPNPAAQEPDAHIRAYAEAVRRAGGLDLCVLGVGVNGHVAFNEPGSGADSRARLVTLTADTRDAHAAAFGSIARVPAHGVTLGIADILKARALLVLASGAHKADVVRRALEDAPHSDVPASFLQRHENAHWLLDEAAASALSEPVRVAAK